MFYYGNYDIYQNSIYHNELLNEYDEYNEIQNTYDEYDYDYTDDSDTDINDYNINDYDNRYKNYDHDNIYIDSIQQMTDIRNPDEQFSDQLLPSTNTQQLPTLNLPENHQQVNLSMQGGNIQITADTINMATLRNSIIQLNHMREQQRYQMYNFSQDLSSVNRLFVQNTENDQIYNQVVQGSQDTLQPVEKHIITDEGKQELYEYIFSNTDERFNEEKYNNICPISLEDFRDGDNIIEIPCKHRFIKDNILTWLEEQSASCPVCRYELDSKKITVKECR